MSPARVAVGKRASMRPFETELMRAAGMMLPGKGALALKGSRTTVVVPVKLPARKLAGGTVALMTRWAR